MRYRYTRKSIRRARAFKFGFNPVTKVSCRFGLSKECRITKIFGNAFLGLSGEAEEWDGGSEYRKLSNFRVHFRSLQIYEQEIEVQEGSGYVNKNLHQ